MVSGKMWLFSIGNGAEFLPLKRAENPLHAKGTVIFVRAVLGTLLYGVRI